MTTGKGDTGAGSEKAPASRAGHNPIDENLRRVYDDMLEDNVPDRFEDLLRQLREQDNKK